MAFAPLAIAGATGLLGSLFGSKGQKGGFQQVQRFTPEQQAVFQQMYGPLAQSMGLSFDKLQQLLSDDPEAFAAFEAPFKRQFEQETVPMIAERFAGMGSHGSQSSSAMQQTLGQAGRELTENLAGLRAGLQQNAMGQLQGFLGQALQPQFENVYMQPTAGTMGGMMSGLGQGAGQYLGMAGLRALGVG